MFGLQYFIKLLHMFVSFGFVKNTRVTLRKTATLPACLDTSSCGRMLKCMCIIERFNIFPVEIITNMRVCKCS